MQPTNYDITTKEKVKAYLGITGTGFDALFDMLIRQITGYVEGEIKMRLKETDYINELYEGGSYEEAPRQYIHLRQYPVTEFTSLEFKGGTETTPVWTLIDPNYYTRDDARGRLWAHQGFIRGFQNIRATYKAGFKIDFPNETTLANHTLPVDLVFLATELVAKKFNTRQAQGISSETTEGQSVTYLKGEEMALTADQASILDSYRRTFF